MATDNPNEDWQDEAIVSDEVVAILNAVIQERLSGEIKRRYELYNKMIVCGTNSLTETEIADLVEAFEFPPNWFDKRTEYIPLDKIIKE